MGHKLIFLLGILLLTASLRLAGTDHFNEYRFQTVDITDGLSQNSLMAIAQDKYGFMWFGTEDGLDRFDGVDFVHFRYEPMNPHSLSSSSIQALMLDSHGDLWVGTYASGLNKYRYETEDFVRFFPDTTNGFRLAYGSIFDMIEDRSGTFWIGTEFSGMIHFNPENSQFTAFQDFLNPGDTLSSPIILQVMQDHTDKIWIATADGLNVFDPYSKRLETYYHDPDDETSIFGDYVSCLFESYDGENYSIWVGSSWGGFDRYDAKNDRFIPHGFESAMNPDFPEIDILSMIEETSERLWLGTNGRGVLIVDNQGKILQTLERKIYNSSALQDDIIQNFFINDHILWVGTLGGGVSLYDPTAKGFSNLSYDPLDPSGLHDNRILGISGNSKGQLWIATWTEGLTLYDPLERSFQPYLSTPDTPGSLSTNDIQDILVDSNDNLWVSSGYPNLDVLYAGEDKFVQVLGSDDPSNGLMADYIVSFLEDSQGYIWMGTWGEGLVRLDPESMEFTLYTEPAVGDISLGDITAYVLFEDSRGMLWIGAENNGLVGFNRNSQTLIQYLTSPGDPHTLPNNDILCFYEDADSMIWMGTYGGGLTRFDPANLTFNTFSKPEGLLSDVVYKIFESADGFLWCSTNKGLSRFNKTSQTFENFGLSDGVISEEFNPAGYQSPAGILYFGGVSGITHFDPLEIKMNQHLPRVHFTQLSIMNKPISIGEAYNGRVVLEQSLLTLPEIILAPQDLMFSLQVAGLEYSHSSSNQFAYLLEGFDEDWRFIGTERDITFTNLPPGKYTLKLKGSNNDGAWTDQSVDLPIRILPAFYETIWFIAGVIVFFVGAFLVVYKVRTNFLVQQKETLEKHNVKLNAEIKSRKEAHRVARDRAEYFRAIISQSPVPMAIHNLDGNITQLNKGWLELWDASDADALIKTYHVKTDAMAKKMDLGQKFERAMSGHVIEHSELAYEEKTGETKIVQLLLYPLKNNSGVTSQVMVSIDDITEIVTHRKVIERSLNEKELLLKEVHHRVKNNLQIISSLLGLQKAGIDDAKIRGVLEEFRSRVNSMALVHDALYRSPDFDEIDIATYLHGLLDDLQMAFEQDTAPVEITTDISKITLPVDIAVPCGLIINELVTNALKYAYVDFKGERKQLKITCKTIADDLLQLDVEDNGRGFQQPIVWDSVSSLGLYLVKILSEQQLMGTVEASDEAGAKFSIRFPLHPNYDD